MVLSKSLRHHSRSGRDWPDLWAYRRMGLKRLTASLTSDPLSGSNPRGRPQGPHIMALPESGSSLDCREKRRPVGAHSHGCPGGIRPMGLVRWMPAQSKRAAVLITGLASLKRVQRVGLFEMWGVRKLATQAAPRTSTFPQPPPATEEQRRLGKLTAADRESTTDHPGDH
jgi:hypothetical protein